MCERRRCPGRHLVESTLFLFIASILAAFDVRKPIHGFKEPEYEGFLAAYVPARSLGSGLTQPTVYREPAPFNCDIRVRDAKARSLVECSGT